MILPPKRQIRPIPTAWREAPLDMQAQGFKAMVVMHIPVRRDWTADQRLKVAQALGDAIIAALSPFEGD